MEQKQKRPAGNKFRAIRFVVIFALLEALFYVVWMGSFFEDHILPLYLRAMAESCSSVMSVFGESVHANGDSMEGPQFSMVINRGCDGLEALALYCAAVSAFPARVRSKLLGIFLGAPLLVVINFLRLITLYYSGVHAPSIFEPLHLVVWPAIIIFASVALWILWARMETVTPQVQ